MDDVLQASHCRECDRSVWPPFKYCPRCLGEMRPRSVPTDGTIVGVSGAGGEIFCVADFAGIRLICSLGSGPDPGVGRAVRLVRVEGSGRDRRFFARVTG